MARVAIIVLAAGMSRRFGSAAEHKLLAPLGPRPVVRHAVNAAIEAAVGDVVVVTGAARASVEDALRGLPVALTYAADHADGMAASLRAGIRAVMPDADAAVIALGDQPTVRPDAYRRVVARWQRDGASIVVSRYANAPDVFHPVVFASRTFPELLSLTGDVGARMVIRRDASRVAAEELSWGAPRDIDTDVDLTRARSDLSPEPR